MIEWVTYGGMLPQTSLQISAANSGEINDTGTTLSGGTRSYSYTFFQSFNAAAFTSQNDTETFISNSLTVSSSSQGRRGSTDGITSNSGTGSNSFTFRSTRPSTFVNTSYTSSIVNSIESTSLASSVAEFGEYFYEESYSETKTTRTVSTVTTAQAFFYTTSSSPDSVVVFDAQTTTQNITTTATATGTFERLGLVSNTTVTTLGQAQYLVFQAENAEVLWVLPTTNQFTDFVELTRVASTATKTTVGPLNLFGDIIDITTASSYVDIPTVSSAASQASTCVTTTTVITQPLFLFTQGSDFLPVRTTSFSNQNLAALTTTTRSFFAISIFKSAGGGRAVGATQNVTSFYTFPSFYPYRTVDLGGVQYDVLRARPVSSEFVYAAAVPGYSFVDSGVAQTQTIQGNSFVEKPRVFGYGLFDDQRVPVAVTSFQTGWLTSSAGPGGFLSGPNVGTETSNRTQISVAKHYRSSFVAMPGSFSRYTIAQNSLTYTVSTSTAGTTTSTTSSTVLNLAGSTQTTISTVFDVASSRTIGGAAQPNETIFANAFGFAKLNNSTLTFFGGNMSSTTESSASASFLNMVQPLTVEIVSPNQQWPVNTWRNILWPV